VTFNGCGGSDHLIDLTKFEAQLTQLCTGHFSGQIAEMFNCPYVGNAFDLTVTVAGGMFCRDPNNGDGYGSCTRSAAGWIPVGGLFVVAGIEQLAVGGIVLADYPNFYNHGRPSFSCMPAPGLEPGLTSRAFIAEPNPLEPPNYGELQQFIWQCEPNAASCLLPIQAHTVP